ncbi:hypothetical protein AZE42_06556 [Rhizopogon vesiculosus]|uniref:Uncharacterized protein n=1 Tax=Rhizopogon vesiculosus TaxID=180088 RepID=A0A1J8PLJ0_9AGAM|nr:hypothetical protein AZE42_06556 [Rhizopogon vesiculosus]
MSQKVKKPKKSKGQAQGDIMVTLVPFNQLGAAFGVVSSAAPLKEQGVDAAWASESEPPILSWLRERRELGGTVSLGFIIQHPSTAATLGTGLAGKIGLAFRTNARRILVTALLENCHHTLENACAWMTFGEIE